MAVSQWSTQYTVSAVLEEPMGINVNAIAPAVARTVMTEDRLTPALEERIKSRIPMGRLGKASDVVCLAAFLASDIS